MGTVTSPLSKISGEHSPAKTEHFRVALLESLKKHEIQGGLREIAKTVRNGDSV